MKSGGLNIGICLGIGFGLLTVMMLIINMRFATKGGINSRITAYRPASFRLICTTSPMIALKFKGEI